MIGIIGKKCGMTRVFTDDGKSVPVTIIQANPNQINRIKTLESDGYDAIQVTANQASPKITKPVKGQFSKSNITPRTTLHEFRIDNHESEQVETGGEIKVNYFKKGELVDVIGKTIGKGYAGVIKRHNFSMQDATHGNSLSHRAAGSIGQNQTPGRVFKGKKMAGQLGNKQNTIQNLVIVKILLEENTILVKGSIPGHDGSNVIIKHTKKHYTPKEILTKTSEAEPTVTKEKEVKAEPKVTEEKEVKTEPKVTEEKEVKTEPKVTEEKEVKTEPKASPVEEETKE